MSDDALSPLAAARTQVSREWEELQTEQAAFEAFADRVETLDFARGGGPQRRGAVRTLTASATRESPSRSVRRAFRETVMAVDHYDSAYGESFEEHLRSELGPDVATALVADEPVFPGFERALLRATAGAIADRRSFGEHVAAEWSSLTDATSRLEAVVAEGRRASEADRSGDEADEGTLAGVLDAVATDRQRLIQERFSSPIIEGHDLCTYLYGDVEAWTYPVLYVCATLRAEYVGTDRRRHRPAADE